MDTADVLSRPTGKKFLFIIQIAGFTSVLFVVAVINDCMEIFATFATLAMETENLLKGKKKEEIDKILVYVRCSPVNNIENFFRQRKEDNNMRKLYNAKVLSKKSFDGRLFKQMLASLLARSKAINLRLSTIKFFVNHCELCEKVREILSKSLSLSMIGRGSPKDINFLKDQPNSTPIWNVEDYIAELFGD
ncbi:hypothetical protein X798_00585 [Onchocerca flexuosa]|uniref:Uncharacterized protein n=1 Tax=Onchocerca flexuosa TaxID=387005 RepID=A0A238C4I9_9BILA|nr:hypothetical protein X798_00585 [Onchocerca flexuosa]